VPLLVSVVADAKAELEGEGCARRTV
jgi:hypothetical protein